MNNFDNWVDVVVETIEARNYNGKYKFEKFYNIESKIKSYLEKYFKEDDYSIKQCYVQWLEMEGYILKYIISFRDLNDAILFKMKWPNNS